MICDKLMCSHWLLRGLKFMHTDLLTWLTFAPWVARKRAAASLFARAALCMRQFSKEIKKHRGRGRWRWASFHSRNYCRLRLWNSTCGSVRCVWIASSLDKLGCKAILIKRGAINYWCVILKWVYRGVWRHGDILQSQPQSCAALMVLEFQVKSNKDGQITSGYTQG